MSTKERLHKLVDELSEAEADDALRIIAQRHKAAAQPGEVVDEWGNLSAVTRAASSEALRRLDEQEAAADRSWDKHL